jgi:hypothetical protein
MLACRLRPFLSANHCLPHVTVVLAAGNGLRPIREVRAPEPFILDDVHRDHMVTYPVMHQFRLHVVTSPPKIRNAAEMAVTVSNAVVVVAEYSGRISNVHVSPGLIVPSG